MADAVARQEELKQRLDVASALHELPPAVCGLSFSNDTTVAIPSGEQAIGSLRVEDQVTAYDPVTGKASTQGQSKAQQVATKVHGSQAPPAEETIHTTENHPWLTTDRGWLPAGELRVGERVVH